MESVENLVALLVPLPQVQAVFLSGSHARGTADAWSDLDLVIVTADTDALADALHGLLAPMVMWRKQAANGFALINAITADWTRIDFLLEAPARFFARTAGSLLALHDPAMLAGQLPKAPQRDLSGSRIAFACEEFLRVLGLLAVGVGRAEWVLCTMGAGHLRDHLITLMRAEAGTLGEGALHLSRSVNAADMATLMALPVAHPQRDSVIAAHLALARAFVPRAKALCAARGIAWPAGFEAATRAHLAQALGLSDAELW